MALEFDLSPLAKALKEIEKKVSKEITINALNEGAEVMQKSLKDSSPVDTGETRDSIKPMKIKTKKGNSTIDVGLSTANGTPREVVERGYYNHWGSRGRAGTYWINEGYEKGIDKTKRAMAEVIEEGLKNL